MSALPSLLQRLGLKPTAPVLEDDDLPDVSAVEFGGTIDAVINYLSVSQLKTAAECRRKWWFKKVLHLEEPKSASLEIGTKVHEQLEHFMKTGEDVLGDIARAALPFLPDAGPDLGLEQSITASVRPIAGATVTADGIPLVGFIDRINRRNAPIVIRATDYKTSKDPKKWAAKPADLSTTETQAGIQMVGYAVSIAETNPDVELIELEHLYLHTKATKKDRAEGRDAIQVVGKITPAKAREEWQRMNALAHELREIAKAPTLDTVPPNWSACSNYGGCSFKAQCLIHQTKSKEKRTMGVADRILNRNIVPVTTTTPPTPEPEKKTLKIVDVPEKPEPTPPTPAAPAAAPPKEPEVTQVATIVPPDAPKSDPKLAAEQPAPAETEKPKRGKKAAEPKADVLKVFVDCMPNAVESQPLAGYVASVVGDMERTFKCIDIRCAAKKYKTDDGQELENPLAYGGWKGVLAAAIKVQPPPPATYVVLGAAGSEIMQVVTEALEAVCAPGNFVRGVR